MDQTLLTNDGEVDGTAEDMDNRSLVVNVKYKEKPQQFIFTRGTSGCAQVKIFPHNEQLFPLTENLND